VTLVDATGIPAVWDSFGTDPARLWRGAFFTTPGIPSTLHYDFVATGPAHGYVSDLQIYLHSTLGDLVIVPLADPANGHCLTDGTLHVSGTMDGSLVSQVTEIAAQYRIRSTLFGGVVCAPAGSESIAGTTTLNPVTLSDLIHATPAVTLRDPAGHWTLMLSLVPTP
jgi:hypothetical protein